MVSIFEHWKERLLVAYMDSFSHNEITADDIIQKWDIRLNDRDSTEVEVISEYSNPIITNDKKFAAIFGGEEYCDIFEII